MSDLTLSFHQSIASYRLPLTLISLEDWALVSVYGEDSTSYLQSQLTLDITALSFDQHLLCAHCNERGKMWSTLRLFQRGAGYAYLVRRNVCTLQVNALRKYAVFSKVTITVDEQSVLLGIVGHQARTVLINYFSMLPDRQKQIVRNDRSILLWFDTPAERFLLVTTSETANKMRKELVGKAQFNSSQQWLALDIEAGLPILDEKTSTQFIPQETNLHVLEAISFKKGCYIGQEIVARTKFRGTNKRALYWLVGKADRIPNTGDALELKVGKNWRRTGTILASVQLENDDVWIQAVLNNGFEPIKSTLRVQNDKNSELKIQPIPYLL